MRSLFPRRLLSCAAPRRTDGVGLAAPQVGVNKRLMVYNEEGVRGRGKELVLCNPVVVEMSKEEDYFEEGCLSFPGIYADVKARALSALRCAHPARRRFNNKYTLIRAWPRHTCGERTRILLRALAQRAAACALCSGCAAC